MASNGRETNYAQELRQHSRERACLPLPAPKSRIEKWLSTKDGLCHHTADHPGHFLTGDIQTGIVILKDGLDLQSLAVMTSPMFRSRVADNTENRWAALRRTHAFKAMNATRKIPTDTPSTTRFTPVEAIRFNMFLLSPFVGLFKCLPQGRRFFDDLFELFQ